MDVLGEKPERPDDFITELKREEESGMQRTREWVTMWQESLRYFLSDQLHGKIAHKDWDWIVVNYIWPSITQEMSKLARNHAKILVNPWGPEDSDAAETWQSILQWQWEKGLNRHGMRIEHLKAILDSKIFGYRISKIVWDEKCYWDDRQGWVGDVKHRLWHPAEFWSSETEYIDEGNCGTVRYVDLKWAQRKWPDFKSELEGQSISHKEVMGGLTIRGQTSNTGGTYPTSGTGGTDSGGSSGMDHLLLRLVQQSDRMGAQLADETRRFVKISEHYRKRYDSEKIKDTQPVAKEEMIATGRAKLDDNGYIVSTDGKPLKEWPSRVVREYDKPKYPRGQIVIRCEDIILNPDEQQYPFTRWPFIITPHYLLPHMWQGLDAVQLYKTTQDMINVSVSHLVNNMKQFGDPRIAVEQGALAPEPGNHKRTYKIFKGAGSILRLARGGIGKYRIEYPVPPSNAAVQLYGLFSQEFKNLTGLQDIAQGKQTKNMTATEAQFLAISSNDRIAFQSIFEEEWVKQVATLVAEHDQLYYDAGRIVRIVGEDRAQGVKEITQKIKDVRFDVDVEPGTTLPFDEDKRIAKHEKAFAILERPIANPMTPEMLRVLEIPGWQKLLQRYEAWQQYYQFFQLYEAVKNGQMDPQQAVQMLVQKATQLYMKESQNAGGVQQVRQERGQGENQKAQ